MKKKILILSALVLILALGFLYTSSSNLIADDKDKSKKDCSSTSSSCTQKKNTEVMSGAISSDDKDGLPAYEFVTDKIHCDACKSDMSSKLMGISGVKEVAYGETNTQSKMTSVKVIYSSTDTTPEIIAASVKENGLQGNCTDGSKCNMKSKTEKKL